MTSLEEKVEKGMAWMRWDNPEYLRYRLSRLNHKTNLNGNMDWVPVGTYHIDFNIIITTKGMLKLQPGTTLIFAKGCGILCYGTLNAVGTPDSKGVGNIRFTGDDWANITIVGESSNKTTMDYCVVSDGTGRASIPKTARQKEKTFYSMNSNSGGGILLYMSKAKIAHSLITHNSAIEGGGIYAYRSAVTLFDNTISDNNAQTGAGVKLNYCDAKVTHNTVENNHATQGGGIYINNSNSTYPEIISNRIRANHADYGAGVYVDEEFPSDYEGMRGNVITLNRAKFLWGGVYALKLDKKMLTDSNEIEENTPTDVGRFCM